MNLQSNIQKIQLLKKSVAILNDVKYSIRSSLDIELFTQERAPDKHLPI